MRNYQTFEYLSDKEELTPNTLIPEFELLKEYRSIEIELERAPSIYDIDRYGKYSSSTYIRRYGSWKKFREIMGSPVDDKKISKEDLIKNYYCVKKILGKVPNGAELNKYGVYGKRTYFKYFGGHRKLLEFLGEVSLSPTKEELIKNYYDVKKILGKAPNGTELYKYGKYEKRYYAKHFGNIRHFRLLIILDAQ